MAAGREKIPVKAAARELGVPERNLYARAAEGLISVERLPSGRVRALVDLDTAHKEVTALRCQAPGCDRSAHRAGRFCSHACSVRRYASEVRRCEQCGESFDVPGYRAKEPGAARFCSSSCWAAWRWANEPETFPQAKRRGTEKACRVCGRTRYRSPSHLHVECCSTACGRQSFREWLATQEGHEHRRHLEAEQRRWRQDVQRKIETQKGSALLTAEVIERLGPLSVSEVTQYYVGRGYLTAEPLTVEGVTVLTYPDPAEVDRLVRHRATGPAWDTWLNPDWRLERARRSGELATLIEVGLSEIAAARAITGPIEAARDSLRQRRRGPKPPPLLGTDREIECVREFEIQRDELRAEYESARKAGRALQEPQRWSAVECAAEALMGRLSWDVAPESAQQLVWRAVRKHAKSLQISLTW